MTTQYEISVVRYDDFGTDASVRVDLLQLGTADRELVAMNMRMMANAISAAPQATATEKPVVERKRRRDAGVPRGSAPIVPEPNPAPGETPLSPFQVTS